LAGTDRRILAAFNIFILSVNRHLCFVQFRFLYSIVLVGQLPNHLLIFKSILFRWIDFLPCVFSFKSFNVKGQGRIMVQNNPV